MDEKILRMEQLVKELNDASQTYYNGLAEQMTDYEWAYTLMLLSQFISP